MPIQLKEHKFADHTYASRRNFRGLIPGIFVGKYLKKLLQFVWSAPNNLLGILHTKIISFGDTVENGGAGLEKRFFAKCQPVVHA